MGIRQFSLLFSTLLLLTGCSELFTALKPLPPDWWNQKWRYRLSVDFPAGIDDKAVTVFMNFTELAEAAGIKGEFDLNSPRVIETAADNQPGREIPHIFEERLGENGGWGYVSWLKNPNCRYQFYFDTKRNGIKPAPQYNVLAELAARSINFVPNPGFETGNTNNSLPDKWNCAAYFQSDGKIHYGITEIYSLVDNPVRTGRKSLKWHLPSEFGRTHNDIVCIQKFPESAVKAMVGQRVKFRAYAYLAGTNVVPYSSVRYNSGEKPLGTVSGSLISREQKRWIMLDGWGIISKSTTKMDILFAAKCPAAGVVDFYLDDISLQTEYPEFMTISQDKYKSDRIYAHFDFDHETLIPLPAKVEGRGLEGKPVMVQLRQRPGREYWQDKQMRAAIVKDNQVVKSKEIPGDKITGVVSETIDDLKAGEYALRIEIMDKNRQVLFEMAQKFAKYNGPF